MRPRHDGAIGGEHASASRVGRSLLQERSNGDQADAVRGAAGEEGRSGHHELAGPGGDEVSDIHHDGGAQQGRHERCVVEAPRNERDGGRHTTTWSRPPWRVVTR